MRNMCCDHNKNCRKKNSQLEIDEDVKFLDTISDSIEEYFNTLATKRSRCSIKSYVGYVFKDHGSFGLIANKGETTSFEESINC